MDRQIVYPGQILPETSLLQMAKDSMIGLAKLSAAVLGTSTMANGFAVTPTGPASLQVVCAPGEIYSLASIDALAFSSLPADTTHSVVKQGILLDGVNLSCPAPGTAGQSINYLVQVTYQDFDSTPVLLPYYNSANPALPFSGMGNNGLTQNTNRKGIAVVSVKAGASAVTGTQVTPSPDVGYVGLYSVTVAFGQTTITAGSITKYSGAPLLPNGLVPAAQSDAMRYASDVGTANIYAASFTPAITSLSDGMTLKVKAKTANTGASTFEPNGLGAKPIVGLNHSALQGGEIAINGDVWLQYNSSINSGSWILVASTGGQPFAGPLVTDGVTDFNTIVRDGRYPALLGGAPGSRNANHPDGQVSPVGSANFYYLDVKSFGGNVTQIATPYLSVTGPSWSCQRTRAGGVWSDWVKPGNCSIVADARNAKMLVSTASATATFTADEVITQSALGGNPFKIASFSKTINLASTGAGGMDTGTAPASGYVALYAIYNPATGVSALLATNATAAIQPEVYGGANMPAGYTASALVSVWPTTAASLFAVGYQSDRTISFGGKSVLSGGTAVTATATSIASTVPRNAKTCAGYAINNAANGVIQIGADANYSGGGLVGVGNVSPATAPIWGWFATPIITAQTIYYAATQAASQNGVIWLSSYTF